MKIHGFQAKCTWSWPFSRHSSSYSSHTWHICASFLEKQYCQKEFLTFSYKKLIFHFLFFSFLFGKNATTGGSRRKLPVVAASAGGFLKEPLVAAASAGGYLKEPPVVAANAGGYLKEPPVEP